MRLSVLLLLIYITDFIEDEQDEDYAKLPVMTEQSDWMKQ